MLNYHHSCQSCYHGSQSLNSNTRIGCERCSKLIKMALARQKSIAVVPLYFNVFQLYFIASHIHNAGNHAIGKSCRQSYFKIFEVLQYLQ